MTLGPDETRRYARHLVLKGFGGAGQQALKRAKVLVVGAGGLGSPVIAYLAAAGIGRLGIVDDDTVSLSNLQRQVLYEDADLDHPKAERAAAFAHARNPHVSVTAHAERFDADSGALISQYDLVLDASDNIATRRTLAGLCAAAATDLVTGAVSMFDGQVTVIAPHRLTTDGRPGPGLDALYPDAVSDDDLPSCEANGILGPVTGIIGTLMAMEAIKLITGTGSPLIGRLLVYDGRDARFTEIAY